MNKVERAEAEEGTTHARPKHHRGLKILAGVFIGLIVLAIVVRIVLDPIAAHQTRKALDGLEGMRGDFDDVHVTVLPPGYAITRLKLSPVVAEGTEQERAAKTPLLYAERIHARLDGTELLRFRLVALLRVESPKLNVVQPKKVADKAEAPKRPPDLSRQLAKVIPFKVERIEVLDGELLFRAVVNESQPELWVHDVAVTVENMGTRRKLTEGRPMTINVRGTVARSGDLSVFVSADPLSSPLSFAGQASLRGLRAAELYEFVAPTTKLQASEGTIDLFATFTSKEGVITGGVKPVLKNIQIRPADEGLWNRVKAWLADEGVELASDRVPGRNAVATTVPIKGKLMEPDVQLWPAVLGVVRNAFVQGLMSGYAALPPPTAERKEGPLEQAKDALEKDKGPPEAQPSDAQPREL